MQENRPKILIVGGGRGCGKTAMALRILAELSNQVMLVHGTETMRLNLDAHALEALAKAKPMIDRPYLHREKQKLSDKFQQPFETTSLIKDQVSIFNGRRQKKQSKRKKK